MATTSIHDIGTDPAGCINYVINDKLGEYKDDIADSIYYAMNDKSGEILYKTLTSYLLCHEDNVVEDFKAHMYEYRNSKKGDHSRRKDGQEIVCYHLHQNFEGYEVDPLTANEIGYKLAEKLLKGYPCVVSTHTNTANIHNHIVFSAWNRDGSKYNDCHDTYRVIRRESDKLCLEYGLNVLEHTKDMKIHKYTDSNGKTRYYEPTYRKKELFAARERGELNGDGGEYSNYFDIKENNRDIVKSDIDMLLPSVRSYSELLERLREFGYEIKDKTKSGEWRKHISFTPPVADKATRDGNIGITDNEKEFYRRENLERYIAERFEGMLLDVPSEHDGVSNSNELKYFEEYSYPQIEVAAINEYHRLRKKDDGEYERVRRSPIEKDVIKVIRRLDVEIKGGIDTRRLDIIIEEQRRAIVQGRRYVPKDNSEAIVVQIQDAFRSLRFMEKNNVFTFDQINDLYKTLYVNYERNISEYDRLRQLVNQTNVILDLPNKAELLTEIISSNMMDDEYRMEHYSDDITLLKSYRDTMARYNINTAAGVGTLRSKVDATEVNMKVIEDRLCSIKARLGEYEHCIRVLSSMEAEERQKYETAFNSFSDTQKLGHNVTRE